MDDLANAIRPFVVTLFIIVTYVVVMQLVNDPGCAAIETSSAPMLGEGFIKLVALCWW